MSTEDENTSHKLARGRPKGTEQREHWHVRLDPDLSLFWRFELHDEFTGRLRKGAMSDLVSQLLREEMNRRLEQRTPPAEKPHNEK